ncbi:uncharacterized protein IWZ02DRAFT_98057 [Phyllosticta citriasiana]|uniref:uncharacterized protein n=1 Tax=Phyllosticta citriasiana TaxID=595635 RepID=UPI0030FD3E26
MVTAEVQLRVALFAKYDLASSSPPLVALLLLLTIHTHTATALHALPPSRLVSSRLVSSRRAFPLPTQPPCIALPYVPYRANRSGSKHVHPFASSPSQATTPTTYLTPSSPHCASARCSPTYATMVNRAHFCRQPPCMSSFLPAYLDPIQVDLRFLAEVWPSFCLTCAKADHLPGQCQCHLQNRSRPRNPQQRFPCRHLRQDHPA